MKDSITNNYMETNQKACGLAVVDSPLQLINTLNMMETTSYGQCQWDLLMLEEPSFDRALFDKITSIGIFRKTFFVENGWDKFRALHKRKFKWTCIFLNKKNIFKIWPDLSCDFSEYKYMSFCPAADFFVCNFAYLYNKNIRFIWLEDGMSSYTIHGVFIKGGFFKDLLRFVFKHNVGKKNIECQYLYRPELATYTVPFTRNKASFLSSNSNTAKYVDAIFNFSNEDIIKEKYIYFDNAFSKDGIITNDKKILDDVSSIIGKEDLIIKVHPRNDVSIYDGTGYKLCKKNYIPWEVYFFHPEMLDNKVLIGAVSTAILSPFLYFDSKQKVISLIRMLDLSEMNDGFKNLVSFVYESIMSNNLEVFCTPVDSDELVNALKEIQNG